MEADRDDRRTVVMLTHALHTATGSLLLLAVARAWQTGEHPVAATAVAAALALAYPQARRPAGLVAVIILWAAGTALTSGFIWVAFPLYFIVLHALARLPGLLVVAAMAAVSAWSAGAVLGPVIGAIAAVLGSLVVAQLRRDAQRHRALAAQLREAQAGLAETERARGVLAERQRMARDLHDTVGQALASVVVLARTGGPGALDVIESTARDALAETRALIRAGDPDGEVEAFLRDLAADTSRRSASEGRPLDVTVSIEGTPRPLDPRVAEALRRGAQGAVANVLQHARARRCALGLSFFDGQVVLDVVDDGVGFDPADEGFGLRALRARLAEVGGTLSVDTAPGGTTLALAVPTTTTPDATTAVAAGQEAP